MVSGWFAKCLRSSVNVFSWQVNQDELGTRLACEKKAREALRSRWSVVIDRCKLWVCRLSVHNLNQVILIFSSAMFG